MSWTKFKPQMGFEKGLPSIQYFFIETETILNVWILRGMKSHRSDNLTEMVPKTFTKSSSITLSATLCGRKNTPDQIAFQIMPAQSFANFELK